MYNDRIRFAEVKVYYEDEYHDLVLEELNELFVGDEDFKNNNIVVDENGIHGMMYVTFFTKEALSKIDRLIDYLKEN